MLSTLGMNLGEIKDYLYLIKSGIRESIIHAGKERRLIKLKYNDIERRLNIIHLDIIKMNSFMVLIEQKIVQ